MPVLDWLFHLHPYPLRKTKDSRGQQKRPLNLNTLMGMMVISFASIAENIGNQFYLWNGGFTLPNVNYRDSFIRIANKEP
jgi:hypothetical protein